MSKLAYPIIGGPLDGQHALTDDFYDGSWRGSPAGIYAHLSKEYIEFNCAGGSGRKVIGGFPPSMVFIHKETLQPLISPKDR